MAAAAELMLSDSRGPARGLAIGGVGMEDDEGRRGFSKAGGKGRKKIGESTTACLINKTMVTNYSFHFLKKILLPE
jgi:hypothetical protein